MKVWQQKSERWGRLVESAVGAHLINSALGADFTVGYWRQGNYEVDFVLTRNDRILAIEVKSGRKQAGAGGFGAFKQHFPRASSLLIGAGGLPIPQFLEMDVANLI